MKDRLIRIALTLLLLVCATIVILHYWNTEAIADVVNVPMYVMIAAFVYVLLQVLKRFYFKQQNWWDWLYYIALIAIVLPTFFPKVEYADTYNYLTDIGSLFLALPLLIDIRKYVL